ncbi:hypothetical protein MIR68_012589 [Amoeboaphelidium protococcarum]|nr:hypothetical protein MIR68_012589 [Amoeboaphelidium protococcarum]
MNMRLLVLTILLAVLTVLSSAQDAQSRSLLSVMGGESKLMDLCENLFNGMANGQQLIPLQQLSSLQQYGVDQSQLSGLDVNGDGAVSLEEFCFLLDQRTANTNVDQISFRQARKSAGLVKQAKQQLKQFCSSEQNLQNPQCSELDAQFNEYEQQERSLMASNQSGQLQKRGVGKAIWQVIKWLVIYPILAILTVIGVIVGSFFVVGIAVFAALIILTAIMA